MSVSTIEQNDRACLDDNAKEPGEVINAPRLARKFSTSTTTVREFLQRFRHFGLLARQLGGSRVLRGMTLDFANKLSGIHEIFELRSMLRFAALPETGDSWKPIRDIRAEIRESATRHLRAARTTLLTSIAN